MKHHLFLGPPPPPPPIGSRDVFPRFLPLRRRVHSTSWGAPRACEPGLAGSRGLVRGRPGNSPAAAEPGRAFPNARHPAAMGATFVGAAHAPANAAAGVALGGVASGPWRRRAGVLADASVGEPTGSGHRGPVRGVAGMGSAAGRVPARALEHFVVCCKRKKKQQDVRAPARHTQVHLVQHAVDGGCAGTRATADQDTWVNYSLLLLLPSSSPPPPPPPPPPHPPPPVRARYAGPPGPAPATGPRKGGRGGRSF